MKIFIPIFTFYVLMLSCMSCCAMNKNSCHENELIINNSCQDHHNEDPEVCSPFCSCDSCAQGIYLVGFPSGKIVLPLISEKYSTYSDTNEPGVYSSIWLPPEIA